MPDAPPAITPGFSPGTPSAPIGLSDGSSIPQALRITGITSPAASDPIILARVADVDGFPHWEDSTGQWEMATDADGFALAKAASAYLAFVASAMQSPVGITGWTVGPGTGQPTVSAYLAPPAVGVSGFSPGSPSAPVGPTGSFSPASPSPAPSVTPPWWYEGEQGAVRYDIDQSSTLTDEEKEVARLNIGISSSTAGRINVLDHAGVDPTGATDSTAALQAIATALSSNAEGREMYFPPGTYKFNLLVPEQVRIVGAGCQISASESKASVTVFMPFNDALPVLWVKSVFSNYFADFEMLGNGSGASSTGLGNSVAGLRVKNDADNYPGMGLVCERVKAERFAIGFQLSKMNSVTFRDCSAVYNGTGWKGEALSDTWLLHNCHGDFNEDFQIWINEPRSVTVVSGDWGNCSCPVALVQGGGVMIFEGANIESVVNTHIFEAVNSHLILRGNRITPQTTGDALTAAIVRQTTSNGQVTFDNNRIEGFTNVGSFGFPLVWETNDSAAPAPVFVTRFGGICQLKSSDFSTVTRSWHSEFIGALAYRTTNQTIASGAYAVVTWSADQNDAGANFDHATGIFTAPVSGWYMMSVSLVVSESNSGYTRINERVNGTNATIIDSANNHEAFRPLVGTRLRYLAAGHTWAVAIFHNKGSDMTVRGTGSAEDSTISIQKL